MSNNSYFVMSGFALTALCAAGAANAQTQMTYGTYMPTTHVVVREGVEPLVKSLAEKSGGEIEFEVLAGGVAGSYREALSTIGSQLVDAGYVVDAGFPKQLPAHNLVTNLSLLVSDEFALTGAVNEFRLLDCPQCSDEAERNGTTPLAYHSTTRYVLMCAGDIKGLSDLRGRKIRGATSWATLSQAFGGVQVNASSSELFEALQRGQIDCAIGSDVFLDAYSLKEVVGSVVDMSLGSYFGGWFFAANDAVWQDADDEVKAAILAELPGTLAKLTLAYRAEMAKSIEDAKAAGVSFNEPDQAFRDTFATAQESAVEEAIKRAEADGVADARALVERFLEIKTKWEGLTADLNDDTDKFAELLQEHVYSKISR
ncbi:C4-dicarboxylate TRAP transporter substrate-binding protein [Aliihoeflea sp. PC F10.4]